MELPTPSDEVTQAALAQLLRTLAHALYAAAGALVLMMFLLFVLSDGRPGRAAWPHQYWVAVVPVLAAGLTLDRGAWAVRTRASGSEPSVRPDSVQS